MQAPKLSAYELQRLKNIEDNQAHLATLGLDEPLIPMIPPPKPLSKKRKEPEPTEPLRESSRLAGKVVPNYAEQDRLLDELDPDASVKKRRGRPSHQPDRYDSEHYEKPRRQRKEPCERQEARKSVEDVHKAMLASFVPQPAKMPSNAFLLQLWEMGFTEQHLSRSEWPEHTRNSYSAISNEMTGKRRMPTCPYELIPFQLWSSAHTGKPQVKCPMCNNYFSLTNKGKINGHGNQLCKSFLMNQ